MAEYIEKEKVINELRYNNKVTHYSDDKCEDIVYRTTREMQQLVFEMPAAGVQPVKRGKWIAENRDSRGYADCYTCSNCQNYTYTYTLMRDCEYDYCPNCGAKMDDTEAIKG